MVVPGPEESHPDITRAPGDPGDDGQTRGQLGPGVEPRHLTTPRHVITRGCVTRVTPRHVTCRVTQTRESLKFNENKITLGKALDKLRTTTFLSSSDKKAGNG